MTHRLTMVELIILISVIVIAAVLILPAHFFRRSDPRGHSRARCSGNLKQIGVAMLMYSGDFSGYFPPTTDGNSFEPLNTSGYLNDSRVYKCPSAASGRDTAADADYWYAGGGYRDDDADASSRRLAYDLFGNHGGDDNEWMNVLFIDGHMEGGKPGPDYPFSNSNAVITQPTETTNTPKSTPN